MITIQKTAHYDDWIKRLRDARGVAIITQRLLRLQLTGHFGDVKAVGEGVLEMRIHVGPGYRVYYTMRGDTVVLLLVGGDKSSQDRDIRKAIQIKKETP